MAQDYKFTLSEQERSSHLWIKMQAHFEYILARERARNDHLLKEDTTAMIRGKIALAKELIDLNERDSIQEVDSQDA